MKKTYIIGGIVIIAIAFVFLYFRQGPVQTSIPPQIQASQKETIQVPVAFLPDATSSAQSISTVPPNGDGNPYGIVFVPAGFPIGGKLNPGDILVSNWNDNKNIQGAGTTIVKITPTGQQSIFFQGQKGLGLTTALAVLKSGFVIVGNLPTTDGTGATAKAGSLLVLDNQGNIVTTLTDTNLINGPWDMAVNDNGLQVQAFVTNVLSGTVVRFDMTFNSAGLVSHTGTMIASGYAYHTDPNVAVVGPTGLFYDVENDSLIVAATADNAIYSIANAGSVTTNEGKGKLVYQDDQYLRGPLAITKAPNGDFIVANGDAINPDKTQTSELVEFTSGGIFVKKLSLDSSSGGAFGFAIDVSGGTTRLAAVNDNIPSLFIWTMSPNNSKPTTATIPETIFLKTATNVNLGTYLVAANGMTLYQFAKDTTGVSNCSGACATAWPPYIASAPSLTGEAGITGLISTITRPDGTKQATYNGMPLYFWQRDLKAGDVTGQNINGFTVVGPTAVLIPAPTPKPSPVLTPTKIPSPVTHNVTIQSFSFNPTPITVKMGDTVVWTNKDSVPHTVTGDNGGLSSPAIDINGTYGYTFNSIGTFDYHCAIHSSMTGTVTVTR